MEIKLLDRVQIQVQHTIREYQGVELEEKLIHLVKEWFQKGFATGIDYRVKQKEHKQK